MSFWKYRRYVIMDISRNQPAARRSRSSAAPRRRKRMKLSARNRLAGRIIAVTKGQTTAHVRIDIGGAVVTASITNEAVDELELAVGAKAYAVIKASDVMVAID
jgi:molybdopterin-binding protein